MHGDVCVVKQLPLLPQLEAKDEPTSNRRFIYGVSTNGHLVTHRAVLETLDVEPTGHDWSVTLKFVGELLRERYVKVVIEAIYGRDGVMIYAEISLERNTLTDGPHPLFPTVEGAWDLEEVETTAAIGA